MQYCSWEPRRQWNSSDKKSMQQVAESNIRVDNGTVAMETTHVWTPQTPVLTIIAQCTVHTLKAITSLFSSIHMVWKLPLGITLQLCLPYSQATTMVFWYGRFQRRSTFKSATNSTLKTRRLSLLLPPTGYPSDGLPETHCLPWWTSTSSHTARCSAKLKTFF